MSCASVGSGRQCFVPPRQVVSIDDVTQREQQVLTGNGGQDAIGRAHAFVQQLLIARDAVDATEGH